MTTVNMFKNHPNKDNIHFVVLPMVREVLGWQCDIAMDCHEMMQKFSEGAEYAGGLKFDFSRMFLYGIPQLWQVFTLSHVNKQKEVVSQIRKINPEPNSESVQKTNVIEVLKDTLPKYQQFEDNESTLRRCAGIQEFMKENLRMNPLEGHQKYAVVCHSMLIAAMTSDGLTEEPLEGPKGLKNHTWT